MGSPKPAHIPLASEDELLDSIRGILGNGIESFGLRDDAGVLRTPGWGSLVVSVDSVVDGIHVDLALCEPADVGWKALMQALSDLAAVGATPLGALIVLCVPGGSGEGTLALGVMRGVAEASEAAVCAVVGGDVSEAAVLVVAVTVLGVLEQGGPPPVSRGGRSPVTSCSSPGPAADRQRASGNRAPARQPAAASGPTVARWPACARVPSPGCTAPASLPTSPTAWRSTSTGWPMRLARASS